MMAFVQRPVFSLNWRSGFRRACTQSSQQPEPETGNSSNSAAQGRQHPNRGREVEVEIITRDGVVKRKVKRPEETFNIEIRKQGMEFAGLDFGDKKKGPSPAAVPLEPPSRLPKVEIVTRDAPTAAESDEGDMYKPKVSTWGVFPRPANISKTYGGGRTIQPGEALETEEERLAREAKTQQLLGDYRRKMGLDIEPETKAECEQMMKDGNELMKQGKLSRAFECFEQVCQKMVFQTEVHGQAALQKAVCLESLSRSREARGIYEKLLSHPSPGVKKRAKQLIFGFQAAERLKSSTSSDWDPSFYRQYFDRLQSYKAAPKAAATAGQEEQVAEEAWPALLVPLFVLVLPLVLVLLAAVGKSRIGG